MNLFERIISFLDETMSTPQSYGWFHIMFICIVVIFTILFVKIFKNSDDKKIKKIILIWWAILLILEIYKQLVFSFNVVDGMAVWNYAWFVFPFQFCSTPLYILPLIFFLKKSKYRDAIITFAATFSLFAGVVVLIYPNDVFSVYVGINIQTMIHHGSQVILGVFFFIRNVYKNNVRELFKGCIVFVVFVFIALLLNIVIFNYFQANGIDQTCNLFFISPYFDCTLPVFSILYQKIPYVIFLGLYMISFTLAAILIFYFQKSIYKVFLRLTK